MDDLQTLLRPLLEQPETAPEPVEWIAAQARRRTRRRRSVQFATAALVLAVPTWLVVRDEPAVDTTTGPAATGSTTTTAPPTTTSTTALPADPFGSAAPWTGAPLPGSAAPAYVEAAAGDPEAAASCPVVAPGDLGDGAGATPRTIPPDPSGMDRWGVVYDLPGAPGTPEDGDLPTPDAGRSTFGIDAIVMPPPPAGWAESEGIASVHDLVTKRAATHTWSDGSVAGWGDLLPSPSDGPEVAEPPRAFIQFQLQGADPSCLYSAYSHLGDDHTFHLVEQLRRVEGT